MGKILLKLTFQLLALCIVIAVGTWLLNEFVWWLVRNGHGQLFTKIGAIFCTAGFALFFYHFVLHDGKQLFKDKEK